MRCGRRRVRAAPVLVAVEALPLGFGSRGAGVRRFASCRLVLSLLDVHLDGVCGGCRASA